MDPWDLKGVFFVFRPVLLSSVIQSSHENHFFIKNLSYFQKMTTLLSYRLLKAPGSGLGSLTKTLQVITVIDVKQNCK